MLFDLWHIEDNDLIQHRKKNLSKKTVGRMRAVLS